MRTVNDRVEPVTAPHHVSVGSPARLVVIIGALSAFGPLSIDMYLPALPSLPQEFGGTASQVQLTLSACLLGLAAGQVIAGPLSDRMGRRPLLVGLLMYALASLLCAVAPTLPMLIAFRLLQGLAGAAGIVIARAVVRDLFSGPDVARFFALTMLVNGLAPILAPIIGGQLLTFTTWRGVFVVLTACSSSHNAFWPQLFGPSALPQPQVIGLLDCRPCSVDRARIGATRPSHVPASPRARLTLPGSAPRPLAQPPSGPAGELACAARCAGSAARTAACSGW